MSPSYTAPAFSDFLQAERKRIAQAFSEVEEIQKDYQGKYTAFKTDHDKTLRELVDQILAAPDSIGATLRKSIDARLPVEKKWVADRMATLDQNAAELTQQADGILARAQKEEADLAAINPKVNDKEEGLKADLATWQKTLDDLNAQVQKLGGGLGFIFRAEKIAQLDRDRYRALGRIEELSKALNKARKDWQDLQAMVVKEDSDWKTQWQQAVARSGALRTERDDLAQNTDLVVARRATTYEIDNLKTTAPATQPALDTSLKQMVVLNIQTDDYQAALGSIAGILATAKGMDEGLSRLNESVKALMDEQNRNDQYLAPLSIVVTDQAIAFGQVWDDLAAKAHDEKAFADHPKDFVAAMQPFVDTRLTATLIGQYFDALGQALQKSTAGWAAKAD
jgi:chromosome segregation ATPase